ncbi:PREDICTED: WAP, Kazal, immunoglobulin, Kunitz and NTR domain-containing protein 1 [Corvus brachyrhynchos]|uniref:WAP, Kazal, immunoglobulin, Kunitz and NTR domain-containing protein 1 n=1 Tax=Corvus brachyrhynchos TaxID=85066 RepID=UPI0004DE1216|nr:PREDICTED: WAP, Kazal, immunoglobulin, Kunitz and NTR domain-containing protein 1 [Corvus brachyrhynchos]
MPKDCEDFEKCCTNVCGLRSCVAARFADGSVPALALAPAASCESFECRAACLGSARPTCLLPMVQGPCQNWEPRWAYNHLLKQCHSFVYGGCEGNTNNFESKETCEDVCPFPKSLQCKACRLKSKMVLSLCRSDFAIVGRLMEIVEDQDSGIARFALEDVLKDEKMGLKFFNIKYLEVTLTDMDWSCPCPNMTAEDGPLIIMGEVHDGMATLDPSSYVRAANDKRVKKIYELMEKKTCDLLKRFQDSGRCLYLEVTTVM